MATNPTIQFKRKTTSGIPASLSIGEPAVNTANNQLFIGVNSSVVKWIGAEIENSLTNGTTWTSDIKLATKKAIGDYFAPLSGAVFTGDVYLDNNKALRLYEADANGSNYIEITTSSAITNNITYILPEAPGANGYVLSSTTEGTLSWISASTASSVSVTETGGNSSYNLVLTDANSTTSASLYIDSSDNITFNPSTNDLTISGDLAVNGGDITTSAATFNLLNSTSTTLNVGGAATSIIMGDSTSATTTLRGGTLVGNTATQNVFNTTATTVNAFGAATTVTIGSSTATINLGGGAIGASVVIKGNLQVDGTTTTVNSTTLTIDDLNIVLADGVSAAASADGGGISLGTTGITWIYLHSATSWSSTQNINIETGKTYKINSVDVLTATTLGSTVTGSYLTSVGTIGTGVWNGTTIGVSYGGTGLTSYTTGQILYASASSTLAGLTASSTAGAVVASTGTGTAPEYKTISVTNGSVTSGAGTLTLAIQDAAANGSTKGLAAFNSTHFDDTSGVITLDTIDGGTYA
jgi:hypothetical protein